MHQVLINVELDVCNHSNVLVFFGSGEAGLFRLEVIVNFVRPMSWVS